MNTWAVLAAVTSVINGFTGQSLAAPGTNATWTGASGGNWSDPANWTPAVPGVLVGPFNDTSAATFNTAVSSVVLDDSFNLQNLTLALPADTAFTLSAAAGKSLLLSSGGTLINSSVSPGVAIAAGANVVQTISAPIVLQTATGNGVGVGVYTFNASGGNNASPNRTSTLKITGTIAGSSDAGSLTTLTLTGGNNIRTLASNEISGVISDGANGGRLALALTTPTGNASTNWLISGANTYTGGTTLNRVGTSNPTLRVNNNLSLGTGVVTFLSTNVNFQFDAALTLANEFTAGTNVVQNFNTNGTASTISGLVSGNGGLAKNGVGTLTLTNAANTYLGTTTVNAGSLGVTSIGNGGAAGYLGQNTTVNLAGGALTYTGTGESAARAFNLTGTTTGGTIDQSGTAPLQLTGNVTASAFGNKSLTLQGSTAAAGELSGAIANSALATTASAAAATGATTITVATATNVAVGQPISGSGIAPGTTITAVSGTTLTLSAATTADIASGQAVAVTGLTGVTKAGTGTWTLSGNSTYAGVTAVNAGTLKVGSVTGLGVGTITLPATGVLDLNGFSVANKFTANGTRGTLTNSGVAVDLSPTTISNNGTFTVDGAGAITLGTVTGTNASNILVKNGNGTLTLAGTADNAFLTVNQNAGTVILNKAALVNNAGANGFNVNGGTLQFGPIAATSANRQVNSLNLTGTAGIATVDLHGAIGNGGTVIRLIGAAGTTIVNTSATAAAFTVASNSAVINDTFAGTIGGNVSFAKAGTSGSILTLSGANTYTGTTAVNGGTLQAGVANALPVNTALSLANTAGATLNLNGLNVAVGSVAGGGATGGTVTLGAGTLTTGSNNASTTFDGVVTGSGGVTKIGTGNQTFTGANTYTGTTTVAAGTLVATAPAYTNLLTNAGGIDLGNTGGKVVFDYTGGTSPVPGVKAILDLEAPGAFASGQIRSTTLASARTIGYGDNGVNQVTVRVTLAGDADLDGDVDFNDFLVLQTNFGATGTRFDQGNFNYDNATDFNDFLALQTNFGGTVGFDTVAITAEQVAAVTAFGLTAAVPEPAAVACVGVSMMIALRRRRA